ncbi:MAG: hypothetical protein ACHBN1_30465 [Heteroscytonema crispum UTEX LB 1556]
MTWTYTSGRGRSLSSSSFVFPEGISVIGSSMNGSSVPDFSR